MDKIRTYIKINNFIAEIDQVVSGSNGDIMDMSKYNNYTFQPIDNRFTVYCSKSDRKNIIGEFNNGDGLEKWNKVDIVIVKYWGEISQSSLFTGCFPNEWSGGMINFSYDRGQFSAKDISIKCSEIISFIRDKKLKNLLDSDNTNI